MKQHDCERAVEQQHDLAGKRYRIVAGSGLYEKGSEPILDALFMSAGCDQRRMARQIDQLHRHAQEAASFPFGITCRLGQMAKYAGNFLCDITFDLAEPLLEQCEVRPVAGLQMCGDQVVLAAEVIVERALGDAGLFGNRVDADRADTIPMEELAGCVKNAFACGLGAIFHGSKYTG